MLNGLLGGTRAALPSCVAQPRSGSLEAKGSTQLQHHNDSLIRKSEEPCSVLHISAYELNEASVHERIPQRHEQVPSLCFTNLLNLWIKKKQTTLCEDGKRRRFFLLNVRNAVFWSTEESRVLPAFHLPSCSLLQAAGSLFFLEQLCAMLDPHLA